jgi:hypothetical protein
VATTTFSASNDPSAGLGDEAGSRPARAASPPRRKTPARPAQRILQKASIKLHDLAPPSRRVRLACENAKSGRLPDQFGNWNFNPSPRSLRQRSAIRARLPTPDAIIRRCFSR